MFLLTNVMGIDLGISTTVEINMFLLKIHAYNCEEASTTVEINMFLLTNNINVYDMYLQQ